MIRGGGVALLLLGLYIAWAKTAGGTAHDILWCCHAGELLLALGLLARAPRAVAIGTFWLTYGLPMWLLGLSGGEAFTIPSLLMHLGGLAGGVLGARALGVPRGAWWQAALGLLLLQQLTRLVTPPAPNVNLAFAIYPGWEGAFRGSYALYTLVLLAFGLALFALEERLLRGPPGLDCGPETTIGAGDPGADR